MKRTSNSTNLGEKIRRRGQIQPVMLVSLISVGCAGFFLLLLVLTVRYLAAFDIIGQLYYVILVFLGLFSAIVLFKYLRSSARYSGTALGGHLELGGAVVCAALVVIGGLFAAPARAFTLSVLVHGEKGEHDLVLRKTGTVWITLNGDRRREEIDDKGQAEFKNIPAPFRGKTVPISIEAEGFEASAQNYALAASGVSVLARRIEQTVSGHVVDVEGKPVANAVVSVEALITTSDSNGHFSFRLGRGHRDSIEALISTPGYIPWHGKLIANSGEATIQLKRKD